MHRDFIGQHIHVGDIVVFQHSSYADLQLGVVEKSTPKGVRIVTKHDVEMYKGHPSWKYWTIRAPSKIIRVEREALLSDSQLFDCRYVEDFLENRTALCTDEII